MELYSPSLYNLNGLTSSQNEGVRTKHSRVIFLPQIPSTQLDLIILLLQMKLTDTKNAVDDISFEKNNNENRINFSFQET